MLTKTQALAALPKATHNTARNLLIRHGKKEAADYLKVEIRKRHPGVRFASDRPKPTLQFKTVEGTAIEFQVCGVEVMAIKTRDGEIWVARTQLCRAAGFHKDAIGRLSPNGQIGSQLKAKGFSFDAVKGQCKGHPRSGMFFISPKDAQIAIEVLSSARAKAAA